MNSAEDSQTGNALSDGPRESGWRTTSNVYNFPGRASTDHPKLATFILLFTVVLERTAYCAVFSNFYLFLNHEPLGWDTNNAAAAALAFLGVSCLFSPVGGFLAHSFLGKFWTLITGLIIYILGFAILVVLTFEIGGVQTVCLSKGNNLLGCQKNTTHSSHCVDSLDTRPQHRESCVFMVYLAVVGVGIGVGLFRTISVPFGADQAKVIGRNSTSAYFNWLYWCINIGAFISFGVLAYIQQNFKEGFFWGYLIPTVLLFISTLLLCVFQTIFVRIPSRNNRNIFCTVFKVLKDAKLSKARRQISLQNSSQFEEDAAENTGSVPSFLDMAKLRYGGKFLDSTVEDVKSIFRILFLFLFLIPYWIIYYQMETTFQAQGLHMKLDPYDHSFCRNASNHSDDPSKHITRFPIPQAWLLLFDNISIIVVLPILDRLIYPFLEKRGLNMTLLTRITIGMLLAVCSMIVAGILENYRISIITERPSDVIIQVIGDTTYFAEDLFVLWQIPQYALIGLSEVFTIVSGLQYAYSEAPRSIEGIIMGWFYFSSGIGCFIGFGMLSFVKPMLFPDLNNRNLRLGNLDYYFYFLAGFQFIVLIIFLSVRSCFKKPSSISSSGRQLDRTYSKLINDS